MPRKIVASYATLERTWSHRINKQTSKPGAVSPRDAVLDAIARILRQEGLLAATLQHIAEQAGMSISTLYHHFSDKHAIFSALHDRHAQEVGRVVEEILASHADASLQQLMRALVERLIDLYAGDPRLYQRLVTEVPSSGQTAQRAEKRMQQVMLRAISLRKHEFKANRDLKRVAFITAHMLEGLAHGVAFRRPKGMSLAAAKEEGIRAMLAYLSA